VVRGERKKDSWPEIEIILMSTTEVLRGTLRPDGSLELEGKPTLPAGPVRVTVESLPPQRESVWTVLDRIWEERKSSGVTPRSREDIDAGVEAMRREWDERDRDIEHLREEIRRTKDDPSRSEADSR
jgi:hypothetical protein